MNGWRVFLRAASHTEPARRATNTHPRETSNELLMYLHSICNPTAQTQHFQPAYSSRWSPNLAVGNFQAIVVPRRRSQANIVHADIADSRLRKPLGSLLHALTNWPPTNPKRNAGRGDSYLLISQKLGSWIIVYKSRLFAAWLLPYHCTLSDSLWESFRSLWLYIVQDALLSHCYFCCFCGLCRRRSSFFRTWRCWTSGESLSG